jgi:hypothetical protein
MRDKSHIIISINAEKSFNKIQHLFMTKNSEETRNRWTIPQHYKPIENIVLNVEKLKSFPLKSGVRQGCLLSPFLFNMVLKFLVRTIR